MFSLWLTRSDSGFRAMPRQSLPLMVIRIPLQGRAVHHVHRSEHIAKPGAAVILPFDDVHDFRASRRCETVSCTVGMEVLASCNRELEGCQLVEPPEFEPVVELKTPSLRALAHSIGLMYAWVANGIDRRDLTFPLMQEMLLYQLLSIWPRRNDSRMEAAHSVQSRTMRLALDFVEANLSTPVSVADIARAAGVGVRSLQIGFRREMNLTPIQYIIGRRLDHAHEDLQRDRSTPIAHVARRWGFVHMSDFSRRYRESYGRTPSETRGLRRSERSDILRL